LTFHRYYWRNFRARSRWGSGHLLPAHCGWCSKFFFQTLSQPRFLTLSQPKVVFFRRFHNLETDPCSATRPGHQIFKSIAHWTRPSNFGNHQIFDHTIKYLKTSTVRPNHPKFGVVVLLDREIGILLLNNQRHHRALHIHQDALPLC